MPNVLFDLFHLRNELFVYFGYKNSVKKLSELSSSPGMGPTIASKLQNLQKVNSHLPGLLTITNTLNPLTTIQQQMRQHNQNRPLARAQGIKYRKYSYEKRLKLIQMVEEQKNPLCATAKILGIAQTTARLIMRTWRDQGRVFERRSERIKREKREAQRLSINRRKERQQRKKRQRNTRRMKEVVPMTSRPVKVESEVQEVSSIMEEPAAAEPSQVPLVYYPSYPCMYTQSFGVLYVPNFYF